MVKQKKASNRLMKKIINIILIIISISAYGQSLWEPVLIPDTLWPSNINAEKDGVIQVIVTGNGNKGGMIRSYDNGNNWTLLDLPIPDYIGVRSMKYSSTGTLFLGTSFCILRSVDDGDSFDPYFQTYENILNIKESPIGDIYAVGWSNIFRSSDDGITWDTIIFGIGNKYYGDIGFGLNGELYTVVGSYDGLGTGSGFQRSLDNGLTWENIGIIDDFLNEIEVNSDGTIIVGGESSGLYISNDGGVNWELVANEKSNKLESNSQDKLFNTDYYGGSGDLLFSENWGETWTSLFEEGFDACVNIISISPNNTVYINCSGENYRIYKSINPILGTENRKNEQQVKIFPNPVINKLNVILSPDATINDFNILNIEGQKVLNVKMDCNTIDLTMLKTGVYILEIKTEDYRQQRKIIKK